MLNIDSFLQTVTAATISSFDLGQYMPLEAFSIFNTPGIATDRIPKLVNRAAINGGDIAQLARVAETEDGVDINLDKALRSHQFIGKDQLNSIGAEYSARLGQKLGNAVAEGMSNRLAAILAITALTNSQTVSFDANNPGIKDDNFASAAEDAFAVLDNAKVPGMGRYVLAKPEFFRRAAKSLYYGSSDFRGPAAEEMPHRFNSFFANGTMFIAWPSPIFTSDLSADTDYEAKYRRNFAADNIQAIAWSNQTLGVKVVEQMNVNLDWVPIEQSWLVVARTHFGTAALQPEGVVAIVDDII